MGKYNPADYEPVEDRLRKFYAAHPDGRVLTELVSESPERFIVKATIYRDHDPATMPWATGYAEEVVGSTRVNETSALENCETSAVGRALANANFAPKGARPSREEMAKTTRRAPKPVAVNEDTRKAAELMAQEIAVCTDLKTLRAMWTMATADGLLDVPLSDGAPFSTVREGVTARKVEIEGAA